MKRLLVLLFTLLLAAPAAAEAAHPALWHVHGAQGDVWLMGSIHVLPPDLQWHTPAMDEAMAGADVFVFEVPSDASAMERMRDLMLAKGYLPQGQSLRALLTPQGQADFDAALAASQLPQGAVDRDRPWLASLQISFAELAQAKYDAGSGVDMQVMKQAADMHKEVRYLETIEQQFALIAPGDEKLEMSEFQSDLKDLAKNNSQIGEMVAAWGNGDIAAIDRLMNAALDEYPEAKKALLDDRNRNWVTQIRSMLKEKRSFFITVGAGHLAGPAGVPALLRKAGYKVDGP